MHISQLADRFVRNPSGIVKVQQQVWVTVLEVDLERKRISLSANFPVNEGLSDVKVAAAPTQLIWSMWANTNQPGIF